MKIGIIGAGSVGATVAYSIATKGLASRLYLCDVAEEKAIGEAMDLQHCAAFIPPVEIAGGGVDLCRGMDVVVLTAGIKRRPGELRTDLIRRNLEVYETVTQPLAANNPEALFLIVSNPVDLLTLFFLKHSDVPANRIIGSGTLLDTSRLRHILSHRFAVDPHNVHAHVIGEHGEGSVPVWSHAQIGLLPIDHYAAQAGIPFEEPQKREVFEKVLRAGQEVIKRKGATFYGIARTVLRILTAIARDEKSILTVSTDLVGYQGVTGIALSLPVLVGRDGISRRLRPTLSVEETVDFARAVESMQGLAREFGIL